MKNFVTLVSFIFILTGLKVNGQGYLIGHIHSVQIANSTKQG